MARETRVTNRARRTPKTFVQVGSSVSKTMRVSVTTSPASVNVPEKVETGIFKNAGSNNVVLRINASGTNYWTLKPDEVSPKILISGVTVEYMSIGGNSTLEIILEG